MNAFKLEMGFCRTKVEKGFKFGVTKFKIRVTLSNVFNRKVSTFFKRNVRKQTFHVKGNQDIPFGGKLVDFLSKRKCVIGVVVSWVTRL